MTPGMTFVLGFVGFMLAWEANAARKDPTTRQILRQLRLRHFAMGLATITFVLILAFALHGHHPVLDWGWWSAMGGQGSVATGGIRNEERSVLPLLIPMLFVGMLVLAIPRLSQAEERTFRAGAEKRSQIRNAMMSLWFGLLHMIMGIPLSVALAIGALGGVLTWRYLVIQRRSGSSEEALSEATLLHVAYNFIVAFIILSLTLFLMVGYLLYE